MALALSILIILSITILIYYLIKHIQLRRIIDQIQGPEPYWLVGNALHIKRDPYDWYDQSAGCAELWSNPRLYRVWFFNTPYVVISGAAEAEPILSSSKHVVKTDEYQFIRPWLGKGLFVNEGEPWRPRRKMMTPIFHTDIIRDFIPVFNAKSRILVEKLSERVDCGPFDLLHYMSLCSLAVIWETVMGTDLDIQNSPHSKYSQCVHKLSGIIFNRQRSPWLWPNLLFKIIGRGKEHDACIKIIHQTISKVINQRWHDRNLHEKDENENRMNGNMKTHYHKRNTFTILDYWLDQVQKGVLTLKDVNEEANSLLFGGHETSTLSPCWTLHFIGNYPEVQSNIHQELDSIFSNDNDREITQEDLKNMNYLECCIKESLRLSPPGPIFGRRIVDDVVIANKRIPAGTSVLVSIYSVHRDPNHWQHPERFIPERFYPENAIGRHPFAYIPFSAGIRNCIAQRFALLEQKVVLASILRKYKVKSMERPDQVRATPEVVLKPHRVLVELIARR